VFRGDEPDRICRVSIAPTLTELTLFVAKPYQMLDQDGITDDIHLLLLNAKLRESENLRQLPPATLGLPGRMP
jgi:hypothetical protein